jgi:PAS domain S-box-containing protein
VAETEASAEHAILALKESEERYRRLLSSVTDYVYTVTVESGRPSATTHGPGCVAVTGYTPEEYADDPLLWHRMVHDGDKPEVTAQASHILASGQAEALEHRIVHRDGSVRWVRNTPVPRFDEDGRLVAYDGLIADITVRKLAELALREGEEKYRKLVEASADAIFLETLDGRLLDCNPAACRMFGYDKDEMLRLQVEDLMPPEVREVLPDVVAAVQAVGGVFIESLNVRKDGEVFPCEVNTQLVVVGGEQRVIVFVRDLSEHQRRDAEIQRLAEELKRRNAALETANSELEAFAFMVSHDLRTPLVVIDGFLRVLLEEPQAESPTELARTLRLMRRASGRMQELIDALLDFSRLALQPLNKQPVDVGSLALQVWEELLPVEGGREVRLEVSEAPPCAADPSLLRQVLANLLGNALKFSRTRPEAVVRVGGLARQGESVYFVRDNGIGFEPASASGLFDLFSRLQHSEGFEGSGVGLAIVRRIVERHGGRVWAESRPGEGATFLFALPG